MNATDRRQLRRDLAEAADWCCHFCGFELDVDCATIEHLWPRALGGDNAWRNLTIACRFCNEWMGDRLDRRTCRCPWCWRAFVRGFSVWVLGKPQGVRWSVPLAGGAGRRRSSLA